MKDEWAAAESTWLSAVRLEELKRFRVQVLNDKTSFILHPFYPPFSFIHQVSFTHQAP
jgi:hypothetical protein